MSRKLTAPHGSMRRYRQGCRCEECGEAQYVYVHDMRVRLGYIKGVKPHTGRYCHNVTVDVDALRSFIAREGRPVFRLERDSGLSRGAMYRVLNRGRCTTATFDAICSELGLHGYEIEVAS